MYSSYCRLNVHVLDSNRTVLRRVWKQHFIKYSKRKHKIQADRVARKKWYKAMLEEHAKARALWEIVCL